MRQEFIANNSKFLSLDETSKGKSTAVSTRFGSWNMDRIRFHEGKAIGKWTYLWIQSNRVNNREFFSADFLKATVKNFVTFLNNSGIPCGPPITEEPAPVPHLTDGDNAGNDSKIKNLFRQMHDSQSRPRFVLIVLPYNGIAIYNSIKYVADTKAGIHTVCVVVPNSAKSSARSSIVAACT
jgi:hypothetical protein